MLWRAPTGHWSLWNETDRLHRDVEQLLGRIRGGHRRAHDEFPPVNILTAPDEAVLTAELPGIDPADIDITVHENTVTVRGGRNSETLEEGQKYLRQERGTGTFVRSFSLPFRVAADKVSAQYKKGILRVALPRLEEDKPKVIKVTAA